MGFAEVGKKAASRQLISGKQHPDVTRSWLLILLIVVGQFSFFCAILQFAFGDLHISTAGLKKIFTNLDDW